MFKCCVYYAVLFMAFFLLSSCTGVDTQKQGPFVHRNPTLEFKKQFFLKTYHFVPGDDLDSLFINTLQHERKRLQSLPMETFEGKRNIGKRITYLEKHISDRSIWPYYMEWMASFDGEHGMMRGYFIYWLMYSDNVSYKDFKDFVSVFHSSCSITPKDYYMRAVLEYYFLNKE